VGLMTSGLPVIMEELKVGDIDSQRMIIRVIAGSVFRR
jgi:hypothetical protein